MPEWERFEELEGGGAAWEERRDAAGYLASAYGAIALDHPPALLTDVPNDKALIWVTDGPVGQLAYYVTDESRFRDMLRSPGSPCSWMLMGRVTADRLVPRAAEQRVRHAGDVASSAERAAHPDNLLPVARMSRDGMAFSAHLLRRYASALRGERSSRRSDELLTDRGIQGIAATDLEGIADDLERCARANWVAVFNPWEVASHHDGGPLPPFPGEPLPANEMEQLERRLLGD